MRSFAVVLRYGLANVLSIAFIAAMLRGGAWIWAVYAFALLGLTVIDETVDGEAGRLSRGARFFCEFNLYLTLPLLIVITVFMVYHTIHGDPLGLTYALSLVGIQFQSAHDVHDDLTVVGAVAGAGYFYSTAGVTVGHELIHRTRSAVAMVVGRMLLAFSFDSSFSISHVYGHHRQIATLDDPVTARRGEYILTYSVRATIQKIIQAFEIEAARLRRSGISVWSWQNRALRGQFYSVGILVAVASFGGSRGVYAFIIAGIIAKLSEQATEYVQHYGLVRVPGTPISARHSWNCDWIVTNALLYNLALHSDHHLAGATPFWDLETRHDAPKLPCGYQAAFLVALIPPLWHRMIDPLIVDWDQRLASDGERELVRKLGWELPAGAAGAQMSAAARSH